MKDKCKSTNDTVFSVVPAIPSGCGGRRWKIAAYVWELGSRLDSLVAIYFREEGLRWVRSFGFFGMRRGEIG
jgi:hypothetical protein